MMAVKTLIQVVPDFGIQMVLNALHETPAVRSHQVLQRMGNSLIQEMAESMKWTDNFKSNDYKTEILILCAYTKRLIETDRKYSQKAAYVVAIDLLKMLSGPKVTIEKQVFAKEALNFLKLAAKYHSLNPSRVSEATSLALHSPHMESYEDLLNKSLKASRTVSLVDPNGTTRKHSNLEKCSCPFPRKV